MGKFVKGDVVIIPFPFTDHFSHFFLTPIPHSLCYLLSVLMILNPTLLFADAGPIPELLLTPTSFDGEE